MYVFNNTSTDACIGATSEGSLAKDASNGLMLALVSEVVVAILRVQALHAKLLLAGRMHQQRSVRSYVCTCRVCHPIVIVGLDGKIDTLDISVLSLAPTSFLFFSSSLLLLSRPSHRIQTANCLN